MFEFFTLHCPPVQQICFLGSQYPETRQRNQKKRLNRSKIGVKVKNAPPCASFRSVITKFF